MSAVQQEGLKAHWGIYKRALIAGATPVPGLGLLDQGGGLVNLPAAWPVVRDLARSQSAHKILGYRIETPCPFQADGLSDAAYWRTPGGAPAKNEQVTFTVHPVFHPDLTPDEKDTLFRSFTLQERGALAEGGLGQALRARRHGHDRRRRVRRRRPRRRPACTPRA